MLNAEAPQKLRHVPKGFSRDLDAHIYYRPETRSLAEALRQKALEELGELPILVDELSDAHLGPHPSSMFEICFPRSCFGVVVQWLMDHRRGLTILVHQVTGNDLRDHFDGALWMGEPLPLEVSKLDP